MVTRLNRLPKTMINMFAVVTSTSWSRFDRLLDVLLLLFGNVALDDNFRTITSMAARRRATPWTTVKDGKRKIFGYANFNRNLLQEEISYDDKGMYGYRK
uniref:Uncharacterized protein n=1 Tax=Romanomermis culicivorax TaxID=13658 RepID=A0A915HK46_ROMCU